MCTMYNHHRMLFLRLPFEIISRIQDTHMLQNKNQVTDKTHQHASSFPQTRGPKKTRTIFSDCVYNQGRGAGGFDWQRRQGAILPTHTMHYIRAGLSRLATTEQSLIYMIIGGRGARRDNKADAKWCLQTE